MVVELLNPPANVQKTLLCIQHRLFRETGNISCIALGPVVVLGCFTETPQVFDEEDRRSPLRFGDGAVEGTNLYIRLLPAGWLRQRQGANAGHHPCPLPLVPGVFLGQFESPAQALDMGSKIDTCELSSFRSARIAVNKIIEQRDPWYEGLVMQEIDSRWIRFT